MFCLFAMFGIFSNIAFVTTTSIIAIVICLALLLSWPLRVLFCSFAIFLSQLPMGLSTPLILFLLLTCEVFKGFCDGFKMQMCNSLTLHWQTGSLALTCTCCLIWKRHGSLLHSLTHYNNAFSATSSSLPSRYSLGMKLTFFSSSQLAPK